MSKRKRGGPNKPADSIPEKRAEAPHASPSGKRADEPRDSETKQAASAHSDDTKSTPPAASAVVAPPALQGKPIKISNLRVPPLPQLDIHPSVARGGSARFDPSASPTVKPGATSSARGKRKSEPPKRAAGPQAKAVEPQAKAVEPQAKAVEPQAKAVEPQGDLRSHAEDSTAVRPRPSLINTMAPPHKRGRVAEQREAAEQSAANEPDPAPLAAIDSFSAQEGSAHPDDIAAAIASSLDPEVHAQAAGAGHASAAREPTTAVGAPINGTVHSSLPRVSTTRFDEGSDDEIWTEGLEHTATLSSRAEEEASAPMLGSHTEDPRASTGAGALPGAKSARAAGDAESHEPASRLARGSSGDRAREAAAFGSSQSLLSTDYYFRQYGAHGLRSMAAEVDDFGFDPHVDAKVRPALEMLCRRYFRVELQGAEQVPEQGRALLVANRSGALPWDGLVLRTALRSARPGLSPLRWLAEDSVIHYPFMGVFMNRLGAVRACPENAERLLTQDRLVAVFPEGAQGSRKLFRDRYRLQRFGRGGYVKLALKLGVPILPTAIIGAEETNPVLGRSRLLGRFIGSDSVPITPTFPWFGLAGLLPAPVRWRIVVGAPIDLSSYGPESAEDALVVHRLNEQIRSSLQTLVDQGKQQRGSALFG